MCKQEFNKLESSFHSPIFRFNWSVNEQRVLCWIRVVNASQLNAFFSSLHIAEVAEELCKTASSDHSGPLQSFSHDMPLLPSKSRPLHKHTENKENIEGGLDGRTDHCTHGHSGTASRAHVATNQSGASLYDSAGTPEDTDSESQLQRRLARRLKRMAVIFPDS